MSRPQFFIVTSAVIFVLERILPTLASWPIFIFPAFVITFVLGGKNDTADLPYIAAAAIIFDFFSGLRFGFFSLALMAVIFAAHLFKTRISVTPKSIISTFFYSIIFISLFLVVISIPNLTGAVKLAPNLILTVVIILVFFKMTSIFLSDDSRQIQNF